MLVHQHSDSSMAKTSYNASKAKRRRILRNLSTKSSPLLLISKSRTDISVQDELEDACNQDTLEIKELSESPRSASRHSMFSFNPTPENSPQNLRRLSPDSPKSLKDGNFSDDSVQSSPENSPHKTHFSPVLAERRRYMIINEILTTECKYIDNLNTILTVFLPAFEHVVAARDLRLLIPAQLEMLVESHHQIKNTLKQRLDRDNQLYGCVGDIFSSLCQNSNLEFFNMYSVYMGEFKIAMKTLATYEGECAQFKEILNLLQQSPLCERLSLASYLLTPIQRLPRYELLLKELLKHTPLTHQDHLSVGAALNELHSELTKLNLSIKSCQLACPVTKKSSFRSKGKSIRRPRRTLSMLKRFVSTPNIDDYSSGDSSFTTDDMKVPSIKIPRRYRTTTQKYEDASFMGSDYNLSSSMGSADPGMFRRGTLSHKSNLAVSCSDLLLEFSDNKKKKPESPMKFKLMTPLTSAPCSPISSRRSSIALSSSNSSLSSLDSSGKNSPTDSRTQNQSPQSCDQGRLSHDVDDRDGSATPTELGGPGDTGTLKLRQPKYTSTPTSTTEDLDAESAASKDDTLKQTDRYRCKLEDSCNASTESEDESKCEGEGDLEVSVSSTCEGVPTKSQKKGWRLSLFKKKRKSQTEESLNKQ